MKTISILLVEDNEADVMITTLLLDKAFPGNKIQLVDDGEEAINYILKKDKYCNVTTPDLVVLDINLPKLNGTEVLAFIKGNLNFRNLPVIMYTTSKLESDILFCHKHAADLYLSKADSIEEFPQAVEAFKKVLSK